MASDKGEESCSVNIQGGHGKESVAKNVGIGSMSEYVRFLERQLISFNRLLLVRARPIGESFASQYGTSLALTGFALARSSAGAYRHES